MSTQVGAIKTPEQNGEEGLERGYKATTTVLDVLSGLPPMIAFAVDKHIGARGIKAETKSNILNRALRLLTLSPYAQLPIWGC